MALYQKHFPHSFKFDLMSVLWFFIITYLFVDCVSGYFVQSLAFDPKLSQILKVSFIFIFILYVITKKFSVGLLFIIFLFWLFLNPVAMVFSYNDKNAVSFDIPSALRIILIPLSSIFFYLLAKVDPFRFLKNVRMLIYFSFTLVSMNVLSGYAGYGFFTYPDLKFGFKGYFFAGNELSALYILLSSFVLFEMWKNRSLILYFSFSFFCLLIGFSIGTKSTFIFSSLVIFLIPILILYSTGELKKIYFFTFLFFLFLLFLLFLFFPIFAFISDFHLFSKILWTYENHGILSVLLSGREQFLADFFGDILKDKGFLDLIFGVGSGTPQYQFKTIEIDFFDLAMYFGFPIAFVFLNFALLSVFIPLFMFKTRPFAPLVFLINFVFLFSSFLSGHIWNSGMLGISWGAVNALLVIKYSKQI